MHSVLSVRLQTDDIRFISFAELRLFLLSTEIENSPGYAVLLSCLVFCHKINGNRPIHILIYRLHGWVGG